MKIFLHRHLTIRLACAIALICLAGCSDDDAAFEPKLFLETESLPVSNLESDYTVDIVTNLPWEAKADASWIIFAETKGEKGNSTLKFSVSENQDDERSGLITVSTGEDLVKEIRIIQDAGNRDDIYVKKGGTGDGFSWGDPTNLPDALAMAVSGNTIHITAGTYAPTETVTGGDPADNGDITFEVNRNITLKGGYPENATEGTTADPSQYPTILSGTLPGGGASYHVVTVSAPKVKGVEVVLEGLTISNGRASGTASATTIDGTDFRRDYGGGVTIGSANATLIDTRITGNKSGKFAAGLYAFAGSVVTMKNSKVNNNISEGNGGGAWVNSATIYIYDCEFVANEASGTAPGFHGYPDAEIYMFNAIVADNKGTSYGAGFYIRENSKAVLVNCLVTGNTSTSTHGGGGIMMYNDNQLSLISSTITGNNIAGPGGGIYRRSGVNTVSIYNSIISGNVQKNDGPDVDVYEADAPAPVIESSIIGEKAYDGNGAEIAGGTFDAATMLSPAFVPVGDANPARGHGMTAGELNELGGIFTPAIEEAIITGDLYGNSRAAEKIMGALVKGE